MDRSGTLTRKKPGHEYTKSNAKFALSVLQNEAIKNLQTYASKHEETQGKFTIGDEKVSVNKLPSFRVLLTSVVLETQCLHES